MYLVHDKFPREQFTGFFASLRMTLLGFIESESESVRPKAAPTQTQTITLRLLSSLMKRSEMRDLGNSSAGLSEQCLLEFWN